MKSTIILSDLHLGNNIHHQRLESFLTTLVVFDRVVFNGDFLDDFWNYEQTIQSEWAPLFELLKTKEVIYLFGNHDLDSPQLRNATADFVTTYAEQYIISVGDTELVVMHGHTIYPRMDKILYEKKKTWSGKLFQKIAKFAWRIFYPLLFKVRYFIELYPNSLALLQRPIIKHQNERMKKYAIENLEPYQILVCGHSHYAEDAREQQFINEGANSYPRIEYLSIVDDKIELVVEEF